MGPSETTHWLALDDLLYFLMNQSLLSTNVTRFQPRCLLADQTFVYLNIRNNRAEQMPILWHYNASQAQCLNCPRAE